MLNNNPVLKPVLAVSFVSMLSLTACGNGGNDTPTDNPQDPPTQSTEPSEPVEEPSDEFDGVEKSLAAEAEVLEELVDASDAFYSAMIESDLEGMQQIMRLEGVQSNAEMVEVFEEEMTAVLEYIDYDPDASDNEKAELFSELFEIMNDLYYLTQDQGLEDPVEFDPRYTDLITETNNGTEYIVRGEVLPLPHKERYVELAIEEDNNLHDDYAEDLLTLLFMESELLGEQWDLVSDNLEPVIWEYTEGEWKVVVVPQFSDRDDYIVPPLTDDYNDRFVDMWESSVYFEEHFHDCDVIHNGSGCSPGSADERGG